MPFLRPFTQLYGIASAILLLQFTMPSHADPDQDMGCRQPVYNANPICGLLPDGITCAKWQFSITPSDCSGYTSGFRCYEYTTPGTLWLYTKAGTTPASCACSTGGWIPSPGNPMGDNIKQAYNNDTQCYQ